MKADLKERLDRVFNPRAVAVIGDKAAMDFLWLKSLSTFPGRLYSVQIDEREIPKIEALGVTNYRSLAEIPDEIDYAVCAVPRAVAPRIVADCIAKGVGGVTLFTSGFAETGETEGVRLQEEITAMARGAGLVLIGPNCMGIYHPKAGLRNSEEQPAGEGGPVGVISQSGTHTINISLQLAAQGILCSKAISIGNAVVLSAADWLEYLSRDPETEVVALYLEGVGDGRSFARVARATAARKPLVVWKGGQTEGGRRAIYSHTASLATEAAVWNGFVRQSGIVTVDSIEELVDVVKGLLLIKPGSGRRVGLIAMTGGQSVVITDAFEREGLPVPALTDASYRELAGFFNIIGGSYRNPLDAGGTIGFRGPVENLERLLGILERDAHVDAIAMEVGSSFFARLWKQNPGYLDRVLEILAAHQERSAKPFATILQPAHLETLVTEARGRFQERRLATFPSFERAARALRKVIDYHRFRAGLD